MGIEEEVQASGKENILNKVIPENIPSFERGSSKYNRLLRLQTDNLKKNLSKAYYS
jgi:hypothetical protein